MILKQLEVGSAFNYAGFDWIKLEDTENGTKLIMVEALNEMEFDKGNDNNWKYSSLRNYLNTYFLEQLCENGAREEDLKDFTSYLCGDNADSEYGTSQDKISLLTCDEFRRFRKKIKPIDGWWWTLTPWFCKSSYVRTVYYNDSLYMHNASSNNIKVRPVCILNSNLLLEQEHNDTRKTIESIIDSLENLLKTI